MALPSPHELRDRTNQFCAGSLAATRKLRKLALNTLGSMRLEKIWEKSRSTTQDRQSQDSLDIQECPPRNSSELTPDEVFQQKPLAHSDDCKMYELALHQMHIRTVRGQQWWAKCPYPSKHRFNSPLTDEEKDEIEQKRIHWWLTYKLLCPLDEAKKLAALDKGYG